jgi:ABC-type protease/lipase transport system fused ATPase/permease subunit
VTQIALSSNETLWLVSLGVGLVVALVVWGLLEALRRSVNEVERAVTDVWTMGKRLAQNTATSHLLGTTKERGVDLLDELGHHRTAGGGGASPPQGGSP